MTEDNGIGERFSRSRRRSWWIAGAVYTMSAIAAGLLAERLLGLAPFRDSTPLDPRAIVLWMGLSLAGFTFGGWLYFRAMDEVEIRDNLVGGIAGLYTYLIALPTWWLLWKGGVTQEPNAWVIYIGSFSVTAVIFLFRRLQAHLDK